jgi:hypothetical protein
MDRVINKNKWLYGPGPLARRPTGGIAAMPPLRGLVTCAAYGMAVSLAGGFGYLVFYGNPATKQIEDYYKENPTR